MWCPACPDSFFRGVYATRALAEHVPLREESADMVQRLRESSLYGETKRFVELYAAALGQQYGIEVPIARCFSFCGACLSMNGVNALASFLADALAGRDIVIRGDGTQVRSFLHGSDMAAWLLGMLVAGPDGEPCNVGSTESVSLRELAEQIARLAGGKVRSRCWARLFREMLRPYMCRIRPGFGRSWGWKSAFRLLKACGERWIGLFNIEI